MLIIRLLYMVLLRPCQYRAINVTHLNMVCCIWRFFTIREINAGLFFKKNKESFVLSEKNRIFAVSYWQNICG